jgi:hypothetical protein
MQFVHTANRNNIRHASKNLWVKMVIPRAWAAQLKGDGLRNRNLSAVRYVIRAQAREIGRLQVKGRITDN